MHKRYSKFLGLIYSIGDVSLLNISFLIALIYSKDGIWHDMDSNHLNFLLLFNLFWLAIIPKQKLYDFIRVLQMEEVIWRLLKSITLHIFLVTTYLIFFKNIYISQFHLVLTYILFILALLIWRFILMIILSEIRKRGLNYRSYVIAGAGPIGQEMYRFLESNMGLGYKFVGFFDDKPTECHEPDKCIGTLDELEDYCLKNSVHEIFCALPPAASSRIYNIVRFGEKHLVRVKIIPDFRRYLDRKVNMLFYGTLPIVTLRHEPLQSLTNRVIKRTFDIVFSGLVITLLLSWLIPIIGFLIKINSKGPVFFVQDRSGKNGKIFPCLKFRSMTVNEEADEMQATKSDSRVTYIGAFLRRTSFDELPQFFNVFIGQMSVIGPRPHMLKHTKEYSEMIEKFMVRHLVKPGITGLAQVNGYRGETETVAQMEARVRADVTYLENWSLMLDVKIIFLTIYNIIKGEKNAF